MGGYEAELHDCPAGHNARVSEVMGSQGNQWLAHCWTRKTITEHPHAVDHLFLYGRTEGETVQEWNKIMT